MADYREDNKEKLSRFKDIPAPILEDKLPERLVKVYPYEFVDASASEAFVKSNTVSIASISQGKLGGGDEQLKSDENGYYYFEILPSVSTEAKLDVSSETSVFGQELKEEDTFSAISNFYYESKFTLLQSGAGNLMPALFVIGEPFDFDKYNNGEQAVFIPTTMIEAQEPTSGYFLDPEGLYEFNLVNITTIENSFTNTRIILHEEKINRSDIDSFEMVVNPQIIIDKIKVRGRELDKYGTYLDNTDVDFITKTPSAKIKVTPISTQDKLTVFLDCFDANVHLPKDIAELATKEISLTDFAKKAGMALSLVDLITDMLLYTTQFSKRFGQVPRNDDGKIDKDWKIGTEKDFLSGITSQDVDTVLDGLYRNWRTKYPSLVNSSSEKIFKQVIASMSDNFSGQLAIGKGQNSFHQNYLLWYFELTNSINANVDVKAKTVTLKAEDIKFKLASKYYNITSKGIEPKTDSDLSEIELIESDRKISLPELPDTVQAIDKLSLPGDINTKTSQDLMYFMNLFLTTDEIGKLYGNVNTPTTGYSRARWEYQQLPVVIHQYTSRNADDAIEKQIRQAYSDARNIKIITTGITQQVDDQAKFLVRTIDLPANNSNSGTNVNQKDKGLENFVRKASGNTVDTRGGIRWSLSFDRDRLINSIAAYYKIDKADVRILSLSFNSTRDKMSYSFYLIHYTWINYVYEFETKQRIARLSEKGTTYDKARFKELIKSSYNPGTQWERTITLQEKYGHEYFEIEEIIISSIFGDSIRLQFKNFSIEVPLFNADDETLGIQRILFT